MPNQPPQLTTEVRRYFKAFAEGMMKMREEGEYERLIELNIANEFRHLNDYFWNTTEKKGL